MQTKKVTKRQKKGRDHTDHATSHKRKSTDQSGEIEHAMDSYEKEKKKKKQILTKNMEVKKIKSTTNNLPGKFHFTFLLLISPDMPYSIKIKQKQLRFENS